jgi:hypothetical protein
MKNDPGNNNDNTEQDDNFDKPCEGFPIRDEVEDFAGKNRVFQIMCYNLGYGYTLIATEEGKDGLGYEFQDFSEIGPHSALGDLRGKMSRSLATRHITYKEDRYFPLHDTIRGRITCSEEGGLTFVVDGIPLSLQDLAGIIEMHEGWQFRLELADPSDDISK